MNGSATTEPQGIESWGVPDWIAVLHNAAKVPATSPRYGEARQVMQDAAARIGDLNRGANAAEATAPPASTGQALLRNAAQGATSGLADEYVAAQMAMAGHGNYGSNVGALRDQLSEARAGHPVASVVGNIGGTGFNPLMRLLGPLTQGLGPAATGAVYGGTLGTAQGFGEGTGTPGERAPGAVIGGAVGTVGGALLGKLLPSVAIIRKNVTTHLRAAFGGRATPAQIENAVESAIRTDLNRRLNQPPEVIERVVQRWRATGKLDVTGFTSPKPPAPPPPSPPPPLAVRPGETLTQVSPRGFEVTGSRAMPPVPTTPTILEMQQGRIGQPAVAGRPDLGTIAPAGRYQTAGSAVRTASPSAPMAGPVGAPNQIVLQIQLARAMGVPEPLIAQRLAHLGITPQQVQAAFR